ncbi:hypothetical protein B484DRAFT_444585, partial [Ochromonadaceae sp. CCMP2298]
ELLDITQRLPCISAISVAFMETPKVTFSLKVASVDVMNMGMGPADFSVTHLVRKVASSLRVSLRTTVLLWYCTYYGTVRTL